jgi:ribulose-phosphate 3-epimerase
MQILPVINCPDADCATKKMEILKTMLPDGALVHLDVTDGIFSSHKAWNNPVAWKSVVAPFGFEVHLMTVHPEGKIDLWLAAGAKRIIVHVETLTPETAQTIVNRSAEQGASVMLASRLETPVEAFDQYYAFFSEFQILAVPPGPSGQIFEQSALPKLATLRSVAGQHATIEIDGGMNLVTAKMVKDAGADIVVSGEFIFENENPRKAYEELKKV